MLYSADIILISLLIKTILYKNFNPIGGHTNQALDYFYEMEKMSKFKQLNANCVHSLFLHPKIEKRSHYLRTRSPQSILNNFCSGYRQQTTI